ncbi:hypothetical protein [Tropicimonas sp. S265A]|uniref:hypothetical protein n=1 Tax=Tropicimonas sp. S265A TaxID=3415134 RepID=UPI003C7EC209
MKAILLLLKWTLWAVYRVFGLGAFVLAVAYAYVILKLELAFVPRSELFPYFATILGMFCGTLFLLPSTTPHWVRVVDDATSATIAIAAIIGLAVALVSGAADVVPVLGLADLEQAAARVSGAVGTLTTVGILCAGGLGMFSPRKLRRVPLMDLKAARAIDPRSLRKSRI